MSKDLLRARLAAALLGCAVCVPAAAQQNGEGSAHASSQPQAASSPAKAAGRLPVFEGEPMVVRGAPDDETDPDAPTAAASRVTLDPRPEIDLDLSGPLDEVPSVALHHYGGPGSLVTVALRGSASDQVRILLGGIPLTPPGGGVVDLSTIPPTLLDTIGITRGAEGAVHGAGALGGVIRLEPLRPTQAPWLRAHLTGGSLGTAALALSAATRGRPWTVAAGVDLRASEGEFVFERDRTPNLPSDPWSSELRTNNDSQGLTFLGNALYTGDGARTRFLLLAHAGNRGVPGMVGYPTPGARSATQRLLAGFERRSPALGGALVGRGYVSNTAYAYDPGESPAPAAGPALWSDRTVAGLEVHLGRMLGAHFMRLALSGEAESLLTGTAPWARADAAISMSDTLEISRELTAFAALRLEGWTSGTALLSPRLGLRYVPSHPWSLFANLGRATRMPTLFELYGESALLRPNPELRPERASTIDIGATYRDGHLDLRLTIFASLYEDLISYELYPPLRLKAFNVRGARILGVEAEGRFDLSPLKISLAYTYTDARAFSPRTWEDGAPLPYRPPHRLSTRATLSIWRLELFAEVQAKSATPRNRTATLFLPEYTSIGAGARLSFPTGFEVRLAGENLLDDRRRQDVFGYPLPGRTLLVSVRLDIHKGE